MLLANLETKADKWYLFWDPTILLSCRNWHWLDGHCVDQQTVRVQAHHAQPMYANSRLWKLTKFWSCSRSIQRRSNHPRSHNSGYTMQYPANASPWTQYTQDLYHGLQMSSAVLHWQCPIKSSSHLRLHWPARLLSLKWQLLHEPRTYHSTILKANRVHWTLVATHRPMQFECVTIPHPYNTILWAFQPHL